MNTRSTISRASALLGAAMFAIVAASAAACTIGGPSYETVSMPLRNAKAGANVCGSAFVKPDLSTLKACGDGLGHCYPGNKVGLPDLKACDSPGDVCVPDTALLAGGKKPQACDFYINHKPGACTSLLVQHIAQFKDQLHAESCAPNERCAPCIDPQDGVSDTHLCDDLGVHGEACEAGAAEESPPPCCHYAGSCLSKEAVPEGSRANMNRDSCAEGKLCAPAALVSGMPVKCDVLGADGVCIDLCFAAMLKSTGVVLRAGCGPTEVCMPCAIGKGQGMPGCN